VQGIQALLDAGNCYMSLLCGLYVSAFVCVLQLL